MCVSFVWVFLFVFSRVCVYAGGGAEGGAFTLSSCLLVNGWSQCTAAVILSSTDNYGLRQ